MPWPPMNLVAEWTTIVAPQSIGRQRYGVAKVLSTMSGMRCAAASCGQRLEVEDAARAGCRPSRRRARGSAAPMACSQLLEPGRVHEAHVDRELAERVGELGDRAAVEVRRGDDLVAGREQRHQGDELRRHAARHRHRAGGVLQRRDALLEHRGRRVADAGVDVAVLLELEELRGGVGVVEHVGGGLVDRHRARARQRVGHVPGVEHAGLEAELRAAGLAQSAMVTG